MKPEEATETPTAATPASSRFQEGRRRIAFGPNVRKQQIFSSNYVSTTRYKLWTIVPLNLFEQFHRVANIWFLIVSTLQMLPFKISPTTSWATLVPLCGMLFVTFCKDAYEDLKRWRDDCRVNQQTCKVFSGNDGRDNFDTVKWSEVKVGNFVKLFRDQPVPADMLLVYSTTGSVAYVDTAQLDGESSLKPKHSADETQHMIRNASLRSVEGHMEADLPNELVGRFDGCLYLKGYPRGVPVGLKNMLLRGSTIRNTSYVIAFVVYTGADTKVVRNSSRSLTSKRSQVEVTSNKLLTIVFLMLFIISIASALARAWLLADATGSKNLSWAWPLTGGDDLQDNPYMAILTFLIGYNNLIPISLYMTTDLVRALQAFIMESDESMYYKEGDVHCTVRSSGLCEDLGQVDFVLSDKTGTLTQNEMCFKACHVAGQTYGYWSDTPDESREGDTSQGINAEFFGYPSDHIERIPSRSVCFPLSPYMWNVPYDGEPGLGLPSPNNHLIHNFFLCLATCHTAMPERMPPVTPQKRSNGLMQSLQDLDFVSQNDPAMQCLRDEAGVENRMQLLEEANSTAFRSPSPDEEALLAMARDFGFYYKKRNGNRLTINIRGQEVYYSVLMCNEFSSERKRMSVLVRQCSGNDPPANPQSSHMVSAFMAPQGVTSMENLGGQLEDGQYILFAKGADSVMMERMRQDDQETSNSRCLNMDMEVSDKLLAESPRHNLNGAIPEGFEAAMASEAGSEGDRPATPDPAPPAPTEPAPPLSLEVADPQGLASLELGAHVASAHLGVPPAPKSGASSFQDDRSYLAAAASGMVSWSVRTQPSQEVNVEENKQQKKLKAAKEQLRHFSTHGLRTLVCGYRVLPDAEAECYIKRYGEARGTFFNRDELMAKVMDEMERDLDLLGITAVEDKIQIGVPETVKMLLDGGIRVWMLTGDCVETAVNIGSICRLVNKDCRMYYLTSEDGADQSLEKTRDDLLNKLRRMEACVIEGLKNHSAEAFKYSLVLNGAALYAILEESAMELQQLFVTVVCNSYSVIACRLSPAQKAAVVELIRTQVPGNPLTLAVGDGGNDVSMIQKAHVGVGIAGAEGREAVNAADFAIGQFRFLRSLLFLHGRSNIRRIGIVIGYSFYKNFLLVICMACYAPFNGFSGTTFYDSYLIMMYNMVFTNLPIFVVGALDVDVYAPAAFALPKLYLFGANKVYFNYRMLIAWLGRGVVHAFVNFFVATLFLGGSGGQPAGLTDYLSLGTWSYWSCVLVANSTLLLHAQVWMDWQILISIISVMLFPPILFIYSNPSMSNLLNPSFNDVATNLFESIPGWLSLLLVLALSVLVELAMDAWRRVNRPDLTTRVQEFQRNKTTFAGESFAAARPTAFSTMTPIHPASSPSVDHARLGTQNSRSFGTDAKLTTVIPKVPGVGERSPCANVLTQTGQELQLQSGISKTERLYPESLVTSLPYSYKRSGYNQGDFRAEAMELKEFAQDSKHPPIKQPGLSLIMEGLVRNRDGSIGLAHLGRWWGEEWRARLSYLQWSQISLMSDVLGGKDANHVEEDVTQNIAEKLSQITGMQRELLHLDHLEPRDEETTTGPQAAPVDYRQSRFNVNYTTEFVYNIFTLKFRSKFHEQAFCQNFDHTSRNQFFVSVRSVTWVIIVGFQLVKLIALLAAKDSESIPQTLLIIFGAVAASEIILFPLRFKIMDSIQASYVAIICCSLMIAKHAYEIVADVPGYVSDAVMPLFFCAGVRMRFPVVVFVLFLHMVLLVLHQRLFLTEVTCTVGNGNTASWVCDQNGGLKAEYSVVQFGLVLLVGTYVYVSERFARHSFAWDDRIGSARNADRDLLKGMYPEDVVEAVRTSFRFNQNQSKDTQIASVSSTETIFQERGVVTVVFIDIYDFERVVAHLGPGDLVAMLDRVFTQMDLVCQEHDVVKIETVGKTFMAAGMTGDKKKHGKLGRSGNGKDSVQKKAVKCLEVAVAILRQFSKCATGMNGMERLSLKIGINTGQVISGVVGSQKPQFALFGDTVNTASRMMSTGKVNHIHISKQTYDYVEDDDRFKWTQQQIEAKGKGIMTTYLLWNEKRQNENGHVVRQKSHREGSILELASSDVVPSTEETTWHACPQLRLSNLPKAISDGWHFCVKVYELDSGRTQQGGSMLGSLLLFWLCFGMESWFIIHGDTGQNASDMDLFLHIRGGFALVCLGVLVLFGAALSLLRFANPSEEKKPVLTAKSSADSLSEIASDSRPAAHAATINKSAETINKSAEQEEGITEEEEEIQHKRQTNVCLRIRQWLVYVVPIVVVSSGYTCAVVSARYGLAQNGVEEVAHWVYYESVFYISAMMHLNVIRASIGAFLCGFLMVLPATALGVFADWPAGAIYPVTVYLLQARIVQSLKRYQLKSLDDLNLVEKEHKECHSLLNSLLPKEVLHSMQSDTLQLAYTYRDMTLLFADIVGFTKYCSSHSPNEAVRLVTHLFARFDDCCKLLGAYKVCTIGDAYLAVNEPKTEHDDKVLGAVVLIHLAMAMLRIIVTVRNEVQHEGLNMRIGLHHGSFVAGVIGSNQLRFDIWGEDVLIGNQMESNGIPGRICCSATFVDVMAQFSKEFSFTEHKVIDCSGSARQIPSYLLNEPHGIGTGTMDVPKTPKSRKSNRHQSSSRKSHK